VTASSESGNGAPQNGAAKGARSPADVGLANNAAPPPTAPFSAPPSSPESPATTVKEAAASAPEPTAEPATCPACGEAEARLLFETTDRLLRTTRNRYRILECAACRLIRLDPPPRASEWRTHFVKPEPPGTKSLAERIERAYRALVVHDHVGFVIRALRNAGEADGIADIGFHRGELRRTLAERGFRVVAVDITPEAAATSRKGEALPLEIEGSEATLAPGSCAVVTVLNVLEHLRDPASCLASASALLRPGGRLVLQAPNANCWQFLTLGEHWSGLDVPRHLISFRVPDLEALLDFCGFEVVRRKFFSLRDNPASLATSVVPGLDPAVRRARGGRENELASLLKTLLYLLFVAFAVPFTVIESACRAGSSVMIEARKK